MGTEKLTIFKDSSNNDTLVSALTECLSCFKTWETLFKFAGNNYE